jgi:hypothetical protein
MKTWPLIIDLQEGFFKDNVEVKINGELKFTAQNITSSLLAGPTKSFETEVKEGEATIDVSVPTRGMDDSITLLVEHIIHIGISLVDTETLEKKVRFLTQDEPFGYL